MGDLQSQCGSRVDFLQHRQLWTKGSADYAEHSRLIEAYMMSQGGGGGRRGEGRVAYHDHVLQDFEHILTF